jgi:hypothetical protein
MEARIECGRSGGPRYGELLGQGHCLRAVMNARRWVSLARNPTNVSRILGRWPENAKRSVVGARNRKQERLARAHGSG